MKELPENFTKALREASERVSKMSIEERKELLERGYKIFFDWWTCKSLERKLDRECQEAIRKMNGR